MLGDVYKRQASQENIKQSIEKANATEANEEKITDKKDNAQSKLTEELSKNDNKEATIKNYLNSQHDTSFLRFYIGNRGERLRNYKEKFPELSYFEIKLLIVGFERGDLNVTT